METALDIKGLEIRCDQIRAVRGIDLQVPKGGVASLLEADWADMIATIMGISDTRSVAPDAVSIFGAVIGRT